MTFDNFSKRSRPIEFDKLNASSSPAARLRHGGSTAGELTSLLSSEIEINKCNVQCCVYITNGGKWRLCQNIALGPIALDSESTARVSVREMARNGKKKLAIFVGTSRCLVYVSSASSFTSRRRSFLPVSLSR